MVYCEFAASGAYKKQTIEIKVTVNGVIDRTLPSLTTVNLTSGSTTTGYFSSTGPAGAISLYSSYESVATVQSYSISNASGTEFRGSFIIKAVGPGTAYITFSVGQSGGYGSASKQIYKVVVTNPVTPTPSVKDRNITSFGDISIPAGKTLTKSVTFDGTVDSNSDITVSSSRPSDIAIGAFTKTNLSNGKTMVTIPLTAGTTVGGWSFISVQVKAGGGYAAASTGNKVTIEPINSRTIEPLQQRIELDIGESTTRTVSITGDVADVSVRSSAPSVATVSSFSRGGGTSAGFGGSFTITAQSEGITFIYVNVASSSKYEAKEQLVYIVQVERKTKLPRNLSISSKNIELEVEQTTSCNITYNGTKDSPSFNPNFNAICNIEKVNSNLKIYGKTAGTISITVELPETDEYLSAREVIKVTVKEKTADPSLSDKSVSLTITDSVTSPAKYVSINNPGMHSYNWSTSDSNVASITALNGTSTYIHGKSKGTATITVKIDGNIFGTISVVVADNRTSAQPTPTLPPTLSTGNFSLAITNTNINPRQNVAISNPGQHSFHWSSSNKDFVDLSTANGSSVDVIGKAQGSSTITVLIDGNIFKTFVVYVIDNRTSAQPTTTSVPTPTQTATLKKRNIYPNPKTIELNVGDTYERPEITISGLPAAFSSSSTKADVASVGNFIVTNIPTGGNSFTGSLRIVAKGVGETDIKLTVAEGNGYASASEVVYKVKVNAPKVTVVPTQVVSVPTPKATAVPTPVSRTVVPNYDLLELKVGDVVTKGITATGAYTEVKLRSSDATVASVSSATHAGGMSGGFSVTFDITANKRGNALIYARFGNEDKEYLTYSVNVSDVTSIVTPTKTTTLKSRNIYPKEKVIELNVGSSYEKSEITISGLPAAFSSSSTKPDVASVGNFIVTNIPTGGSEFIGSLRIVAKAVGETDITLTVGEGNGYASASQVVYKVKVNAPIATMTPTGSGKPFRTFDNLETTKRVKVGGTVSVDFGSNILKNPTPSFEKGDLITVSSVKTGSFNIFGKNVGTEKVAFTFDETADYAKTVVTITVVVYDDSARSISPKEKAIELYVGNVFTGQGITVSGIPGPLTTKSTKENIATVSNFTVSNVGSDGQGGNYFTGSVIIKAVKVGTTDIILTVGEGGGYAEASQVIYKVTVKEAPAKVTPTKAPGGGGEDPKPTPGGGGDPTPTTSVEPTKAPDDIEQQIIDYLKTQTLDYVTIRVGDNYEIQIPSNENRTDYKYRAVDTNVITVNNTGMITGVAVGKSFAFAYQVPEGITSFQPAFATAFKLVATGVEVVEKCIYPAHEDYWIKEYLNITDTTHDIKYTCPICKITWRESNIPHTFVDDKCECGYDRGTGTVDIKKATSLKFKKSKYTYNTSDGSVNLRDLLNINPADADVVLKYEIVSTSAEGLVQLELYNDGKVTFIKPGEVRFRATDLNSNLSDETTFVIKGVVVAIPTLTGKNFEKITDVHADDWFYEYVKKSYEDGLFTGTSDTTFEPNANLTRGMFITVLSRFDKADTSNYANIFYDVKPGEWYQEAVNWGAANGIVNGVGENEFRPNDPITREQMAVMLCNYISYAYPGLFNSMSSAPMFADYEQISEWARVQVLLLQQIGIVQGREDNKFEPQAYVTRAEAATMIERLVDKVRIR